MEPKRNFLTQYFTFVILTFGIWIAWQSFQPRPPDDPEKEVAQADKADDAEQPAAKPDEEAAKPGEEAGDSDPPVDAKKAEAAEAGDEPPEVLAEALHRDEGSHLLGSLDPETGFVLAAELSTRSGSITSIASNDPRYKDLKDRTVPLKIVGNSRAQDPRTFELSIPYIDAQLKKYKRTTRDLNWEIVKGSESPESVTFELTSPDGRLRVRKKYTLAALDEKQRSIKGVRETEVAPYQLRVELRFENLSKQELELQYELQGPVGVPLENEESASKLRDVRWGQFDEDGAVETESITAANVVDAYKEEEVEDWHNPLKFLGVDAQYFAALVVPGGDQQKNNYFEKVTPQVVEEAKKPKNSNVSLLMQSKTYDLAAGKTLVHSYVLYAGPKRETLLAGDDMQAEGIIDYGWFAIVAKGMLWLLNRFHSWGAPYGIAIVMLTILVRGFMFPLSKKQAVGAEKMKALQPKIAELKKKYENDKEKLGRAQMELFSKNNYNPLAGCLPVFVQLPIFIGLYRSLSSAVDLRMAEFLWVDNLAAPDALFPMGFSIPFLGSQFNLLPLITVALFIAQQKMFMPPPTTDEQAMQQKMMNYMMIFMAFMFYNVPAGLCVYFIASSLWGISERKLLALRKPAEPTEAEAESEVKDGKSETPEKPRKEGFMAKLMAKVEEASREQQQITKQPASTGKQNRGGKNKKRRGR